jgi:site-specific recombinase XerD
MAADKSTVWQGGAVRYAADGVPTYHIRRTVRGKRYEVSTRCTTLRGALAELNRFEADPEAYVKKPEPSVLTVIALDSRVIDAYLEWCQATKESTPEWLAQKSRVLHRWADALRGRDLRALRVTELVAILDAPASRLGDHRRDSIATIKHLYTYLITVRFQVEAHQNPTAALRVPQSNPNKRAKQFKVVMHETLTAVRPHLSTRWLDCLDLLSGTGMHITELNRFAREGVILQTLKGTALRVPKHKRGGEFRVAVTPEIAETAARVRDAGSFSPFRFWQALQKACTAAGVERFAPGQMRHTVATYAIENGAAMEAVSTYLHHATLETTKRFYARHATPAKVPTQR